MDTPNTVLSGDDESIRSRVSSRIEVDERCGSDGSSFITYEEDNNEARLVNELGRLYLSNTDEDTSTYSLPVDSREQERLDFQDAILRALTNHVHHAPIRHPARIIDIGTGTGVWCEDIARMFPETEIIGTDLFPMPTGCREIPDNVSFLIEDAQKADWGHSPYSYIHTRMLLGCFENFKNIIERAYDYLEPGGWMESVELDSKLFCDDGSVTPDNPFLEWTRLQNEAQMKIGRPVRIANKLKQWYLECGFTEVHEEIYKLPINPWPRDPRLKTLGKCWAKQLTKGLSAFSLRPFSAAFGWTQMEIEVAITAARTMIDNRKMHAFHKIVVVWGCKPGNAPMKKLPLTEATATHLAPKTASASSTNVATNGVASL